MKKEAETLSIRKLLQIELASNVSSSKDPLYDPYQIDGPNPNLDSNPTREPNLDPILALGPSLNSDPTPSAGNRDEEPCAISDPVVFATSYPDIPGISYPDIPGTSYPDIPGTSYPDIPALRTTISPPSPTPMLKVQATVVMKARKNRNNLLWNRPDLFATRKSNRFFKTFQIF